MREVGRIRRTRPGGATLTPARPRRFQLVKEKKEKLAHYHDQIEKLANAVGAQR